MPVSSSTVVATFKDLRTNVLNKPPMARKYGNAWQSVMGNAMDTALDRISQARRARWPRNCPVDGLFYIGRERNLEWVTIVGTAGATKEPEGDYRYDLVNAWQIWVAAGSRPAVEDALRKVGLVNISVYRRAEWTNPGHCYDHFVDSFQRNVWSQFDTLVETPHPWKAVKWGDFNWGDAGVTWGSNATKADVEQVKRQIVRFKSAHETATWVYVNTTGGSLWGSFKWGDGTWGGTGQPLRWLVGEPHWARRGL